MLKPDGLWAHLIDHGAHFIPTDPTISSVNFLQVDAEAWARYADNSFASTNRLRSSEYLPLFAAANLEVRAVETSDDDAGLAALEAGALALVERFRGMSATDLAVRFPQIVAAPQTRG